MQARLRTHPHLEYRPSGFHWRRRWPRRILATISPELASALFPSR